MRIRLNPEHVDLAREEAKMTAPYMADYARSPGEKLEDAFLGYIGEIAHHLHVGALDVWKRRCEELRGKRDDGGVDTVDGYNIKTVKEDSRCVSVKDDRAEKYIVYVYDPRGFVEYRGSFIRTDIGPITFPNGASGRGVYIETLKP